ncbi:MAG: transposase [Rickettsiales bacterium]|jgi:transposase|nr:transposase [Rickettsiales bacterium]
MDASHFVMGGDFLGYIYGKARRFFMTFSGRTYYNVLSALNIVSKKMTTITNNSYIFAPQICESLKKISSEYVGKAIYIILDNARYQKCKIVQKLADELSITLVYIPPYSPNLNVIERFWKYVKSDLRVKYFNNFQEFCDHIDSIVECRDENAKKSLDKLITDKVQLFDDLIPINESTYVSKELEKMAA